MRQKEEHWGTLRVLCCRHHTELCCEFPEVSEIERKQNKTPQINQKDLGTSHCRSHYPLDSFSLSSGPYIFLTLYGEPEYSQSERSSEERDNQGQLHDSSISSQPGGETVKVRKILWLLWQIWIGCFITLKKNEMPYNIPSFTRNKLIKGEGQSSLELWNLSCLSFLSGLN